MLLQRVVMFPNVITKSCDVSYCFSLPGTFLDATRPGCDVICRCLSICSFLARSLLYIGPNLLRPPRILSCRTAAKDESKS